jgi:hypothetical protein
MKKIIIFVIILGSLLLGGCTDKKGEIIKDGANASYPELYLKDAFTGQFWETFQTRRTMSMNNVDIEDGAIVEYNALAIVYPNSVVYSILNKKFFYINNPSQATVSLGNRQYVLAEDPNEFRVYSLLTTEGLYTYVKDPKITVNFYNDYIEKFELVNGVWELTDTKTFRNFKPVEPTDDDSFDPLAVPDNVNLINGYSYDNDATGIDIFKDGKYYARYYFEPLMEDFFVLGNGNILTLHLREILDIEKEEYDFKQGGKYYDIFYYLYNVEDKNIRQVELPIYIDNIIQKSNFYKIGIDTLASFRSIDSRTKTITDVTRMGSLTNNLEIKEFNFDFDISNFNIEYIEGTRNYIFENNVGAFLVNDKNKVINALLYDSNIYNLHVYDNETAVLVNSNTQKAYIYKLSDSTRVVPGEYEFMGILSGGVKTIILKRGTQFYRYDGNLHEILGEVTLYDRYRGIYLAKSEDDYKFYYADGTHLFSTTNLASVTYTTFSYMLENFEENYVCIFTFEVEMKTKTIVVLVKDQYPELFT